MKLRQITPEFVDEIPRELEPGKLYVCCRYRAVKHLCACGCGVAVNIPLHPTGWTLICDGVSVSLWPSIGNWWRALPVPLLDPKTTGSIGLQSGPDAGYEVEGRPTNWNSIAISPRPALLKSIVPNRPTPQTPLPLRSCFTRLARRLLHRN